MELTPEQEIELQLQAGITLGDRRLASNAVVALKHLGMRAEMDAWINSGGEHNSIKPNTGTEGGTQSKEKAPEAEGEDKGQEGRI
jgi:hypothetical protein